MMIAFFVPATYQIEFRRSSICACVGLTTNSPFTTPDAHRADRAVPGNIGNHQGGGGGDNGDRIGEVVEIDGKRKWR